MKTTVEDDKRTVVETGPWQVTVRINQAGNLTIEVELNGHLHADLILQEGGTLDLGTFATPWPLGEKGWDMPGRRRGACASSASALATSRRLRDARDGDCRCAVTGIVAGSSSHSARLHQTCVDTRVDSVSAWRAPGGRHQRSIRRRHQPPSESRCYAERAPALRLCAGFPLGSH
jgi:hypothetical protein